MALKNEGTPQVRRMIIDRLLAHYRQQGIIANGTFDRQSGRYIITAPNGEVFIYGLQQMESWIAGLQTFAIRLGMGPLDLAPADQKPGECKDDFCESAMKLAMTEFALEELREKYDALVKAQDKTGVPF